MNSIGERQLNIADILKDIPAELRAEEALDKAKASMDAILSVATQATRVGDLATAMLLGAALKAIGSCDIETAEEAVKLAGKSSERWYARIQAGKPR
jgi:hypothetical protein